MQFPGDSSKPTLGIGVAVHLSYGSPEQCGHVGMF
jgi:hypothetical protein